MNRKIWALAAAVLVVVALLVIKVQAGGKAKEVEVEAVEPRVVTPTILASGTLAYESGVTLMSEVVGRVDEVRVREGDQVTRGQLLVRLDAGSLHAEIAQVEASRRQSELKVRRLQVELESHAAKLRRYDELRRVGMIEALKYDEFVTQKRLAEVELASGEQAQRQAEAQLKQVRERLAKTEIRSPMQGKVTAVYIKVGETAVPSLASMAGSTLLALGDSSAMYAELNVDETDIGKIVVGQAARIVPAASPDKAVMGKVQQVALAPRQPTAGGPGPGQGPNQARTYAVKVKLDAAPDGTFFPGMSCRAEISTRRPDAEKHLATAVQAVRYDTVEDGPGTTRTSVLVLSGGRAVKRVVEVGAADDAYIEIRRGLQRGDQVIVGPSKTLRFLRDGEAVRAVPRLGRGNYEGAQGAKAAFVADKP